MPEARKEGMETEGVASMPPAGTYGDFLACMYQQDVEHAHEYGLALTATAVPLTRGNVAFANFALFFVTMPMVLGQSLASNLECSREAGY